MFCIDCKTKISHHWTVGFQAPFSGDPTFTAEAEGSSEVQEKQPSSVDATPSVGTAQTLTGPHRQDPREDIYVVFSFIFFSIIGYYKILDIAP